MPDNSGKICFTLVSDNVDSQSLNSLLNYKSAVCQSGNWNFLSDKSTVGRITTQHTTHIHRKGDNHENLEIKIRQPKVRFKEILLTIQKANMAWELGINQECGPHLWNSANGEQEEVLAKLSVLL